MRAVLFFVVMLPMFVGFVVASTCYWLASLFEGAVGFIRMVRDRHERED